MVSPPLPDPVRFDGRRLDTPLQRYPQVLAALVRALGPRSDAAYALLARPPPKGEADSPDPRATWDAVGDAFVPTWTRWANEGVRRRWHRVALPEHTEVVATLSELTVSGVGSAFVHTLALARDGQWLLVAVPHHSSVRVADAPEVREPVEETLDAVPAERDSP